MSKTVAARLTEDQMTALDYIGEIQGKCRADLIVEALEAQYQLSDRSAEARSFFTQRVRLIEQHVRKIRMQKSA